ncbi:MAG TPA: helicase-related protein [Thermoplasmata archaeon]|nr:helicase-related protein [Thermoplasmata archaeon]
MPVGSALARRRIPRLEEFDEGGGEPPSVGRVRARPPPLPGIWRVDDGFVEHPLLRPHQLRALPFQLDLARIAVSEDLLIVLPTGLGKTAIAALAAAELLRQGEGKVLVLAPTRPLVQQHAKSFESWFTDLRVARFTGSVKRPTREGSWETADAVFATPEIVVNDLAADRYDLTSLRQIVFDESHHAVGKYAYVPLAERFRHDRTPGARVLGLTASPGGRDERIEEVVAALGVQRIEARTREDPGVREFVQEIQVEFRWVELPPEAKRIQGLLADSARESARKLQKMGYLRKKPIQSLSVKDLIQLRAEIFARPGPMTRKFGPLFHQLVLLHLHHAQERLETQGIEPFQQYVERVRGKEKPSRGDRAFVQSPGVQGAMLAAREYLELGRSTSHPKLDALVTLVREESVRSRDHPLRILVFAQYRDTIQTIQEILHADGWKTGRFVGQATRDAGDRGMNQKEQASVLDEFRRGRFPILVASSVAEEGLDVPDVDLVVFFESVASEIRAIQRRGRTGRTSLGRVVVLLTQETRDVGHQKAEARREGAMRRIVRRLSARSRRAAPPASPPDPAEREIAGSAPEPPQSTP